MDKKRAQKEFDSLAVGFFPYLRKKYGWKLTLGLGLIIAWPIMGKLLTINSPNWDSFYVAIFIYLPLGLLFYWFLRRGEEYRVLFWLKFAESKGWQYTPIGESVKENGLIFTQGEDRQITHLLEGNLEKRPLRIFTYGFNSRRLNNKKYPRVFTVFSAPYYGSCPHLYLDRRRDAYGIKPGGIKLNTPNEFAEQFSLYTPEEYEIEALAIFTPDLLAALLETKYKFDIECIDKKIYLYIPNAISNGKMLVERLAAAAETLRLIAPRLDRSTYEPIKAHPADMVRP